MEGSNLALFEELPQHLPKGVEKSHGNVTEVSLG
jgi:hypothetical protein